jgi:hypothetical protein
VATACAAVIAVYPRSSEMRPRERARKADAGVVLVADPLFDASVTNVVRVRVPRRALVSLGIPVVEPDVAGLVDLEMLVGEDGIARSIRRAVPVAASDPQE